ncbi:hypothetical protein GMMP15_1450002 [Candidatus Magnetomoraceae bacterium gMMP-15]
MKSEGQPGKREYRLCIEPREICIVVDIRISFRENERESRRLAACGRQQSGMC